METTPPGVVSDTRGFPEYRRSKMHDDEREACTRLPRSRLGAMSRLVAAPCATSDKAYYVNCAGLDCVGVAATQAHQPADMLAETAPAVRESRITACRLAKAPYPSDQFHIYGDTLLARWGVIDL
jgi:hypothetical protein